MSTALLIPLLVVSLGFLLVTGWLLLARGANSDVATGALLLATAVLVGTVLIVGVS